MRLGGAWFGWHDEIVYQHYQRRTDRFLNLKKGFACAASQERAPAPIAVAGRSAAMALAAFLTAAAAVEFVAESGANPCQHQLWRRHYLLHPLAP